MRHCNIYCSVLVLAPARFPMLRTRYVVTKDNVARSASSKMKQTVIKAQSAASVLHDTSCIQDCRLITQIKSFMIVYIVSKVSFMGRTNLGTAKEYRNKPKFNNVSNKRVKVMTAHSPASSGSAWCKTYILAFLASERFRKFRFREVKLRIDCVSRGWIHVSIIGKS